ncbi:hypothetical protein C8R47DRAFT_618742 [Mycena vitilis]|nr:hypothetical protein C8R47DRAFT_492610 [Mycena vitilis]KAJ6513770.1 hypothetical protein C8R47DRAFT_618742 [Mycena vitilis]
MIVWFSFHHLLFLSDTLSSSLGVTLFLQTWLSPRTAHSHFCDSMFIFANQYPASRTNNHRYPPVLSSVHERKPTMVSKVPDC